MPAEFGLLLSLLHTSKYIITMYLGGRVRYYTARYRYFESGTAVRQKSVKFRSRVPASSAVALASFAAALPAFGRLARVFRHFVSLATPPEGSIAIWGCCCCFAPSALPCCSLVRAVLFVWTSGVCSSVVSVPQFILGSVRLVAWTERAGGGREKWLPE